MFTGILLQAVVDLDVFGIEIDNMDNGRDERNIFNSEGSNEAASSSINYFV